MRQFNKVYLLLGANLGDPKSKFLDAIRNIEKRVGMIVESSSLYSSPSWGTQGDEPDYLNQVIALETLMSPGDVLKEVLQIETELGRVREEKWGSRLIDIDILFYNEEIVNSANLIVPHPYLHERRFTLAPLMEINADYIHPVFRKTISELYTNCEDLSEVNRIVN